MSIRVIDVEPIEPRAGSQGERADVWRTRICSPRSATTAPSLVLSKNAPDVRRWRAAAISSGSIPRTSRANGTPGTSTKTISHAARSFAAPSPSQLVEDGPHFAAIRVARRYKSSTITQTYRLAANAHWLEIETHLDWRDRRTLLRSLTPAAVRANYASCECAYGVIERPTHRNTSWEEAMFEAAAHRFIDLSEPGFGLALLNDGKYGHSVRDNVLGLSLVRSPVYPDPLADEGEQRFTYALCPHSLPLPLSGVREAADALNQPLLWAPAKGVKETELSPLRFSSSLAALSALKAAEDGNGLILRLYEPFGARGDLAITPPPGWRLEGPLNLMEEPMAREAQHDLTPFEVRTWRLAKTAGS